MNIFVFLALITKVASITESETSISSVQVVFNHGARSPLHTYPNNPNNIWGKYSSSLGQLTDIGMRQMYDFGVFLRNQYKTLNPVYDRTRAWAFSSSMLNFKEKKSDKKFLFIKF